MSIDIKIRNFMTLASVVMVGFMTGCDQKDDRTKSAVSSDLAWIRLEGGAFTVGSSDGLGEANEYPQYTVTLKSFEILQTEVTVAQYRKCVADKVCWETVKPDSEYYCNYDKSERLGQPVNCVDWYQANTFCAWAGGRLLTEAEWEYAARSGGQDKKYVWGDTPKPNCDYTVMDDPPNTPKGIGCGTFGTLNVCSRPKGNTEQGVCDMSGNVIEWVRDWYYLSYNPAPGTPVPDITNFKNGEVGPNRVMRGAGIGSDEDYRVGNRIYHAPHFQYAGLGIRCGRDI